MWRTLDAVMSIDTLSAILFTGATPDSEGKVALNESSASAPLAVFVKGCLWTVACGTGGQCSQWDIVSL